KSRARSRSNEREVAQMKGMYARAGPLSNDEIDPEILHCGIEDFFDGRLQAMNFVEEENLALLERRENRGEIAFGFEKRAGAGLDGNFKFVGDDLCERGLAEAGRTVEEHVIERFTSVLCRLESDRDVFLHALLADVLVEGPGTNAGVDARIFVNRG